MIGGNAALLTGISVNNEHVRHCAVPDHRGGARLIKLHQAGRTENFRVERFMHTSINFAGNVAN